jgi:hypothetical protein
MFSAFEVRFISVPLFSIILYNSFIKALFHEYPHS